MHNPGKPQIYPVCFQAKVTSEGTGVPGETVKFPNAYADFSQDFKEIDVWAEQKSGKAITYTPPGPRVATFGGAPSASGSASQPTSNATASSVVSDAPASSVASDAWASSVDSPSGTPAADTMPPPTPESTTAQAQPTVAPTAGASVSGDATPLSSSTRSHRGGRGSRTRRPRTC